MKKMKWSIIGILIMTVFVFAGCGKEKKEQNPMEDMTLSFINIGKGDAFLLEIPNAGFYMCDTGKKEDWDQINKLLKKKGVKELEGIFVSHGHKDHAGNVESLMKEYPTKSVYISGKDSVSYKKIDVCAIAEKAGVELKKMQGGENLHFGKAEINVWIPKKTDKKNENNNSMVLRVDYGDTSWLLTGDMEKEEEAVYLSEHTNIQADVLKLGHHGEDDATSVALLSRVKPKYGIITGNEEENPDSVDPQIAARLKAYGVETFYSEGEQLATDFISDGTAIKIKEVMESK